MMYKYHTLFWVNYNDLTVLPHWESWLIREIIPKWPQDSGYWNIIIYPYIYINLKIDMNSRCTTWKYEVNIIYTILETQLSIFLGVTVYKYIHIYIHIYICWVPNVCWWILGFSDDSEGFQELHSGKLWKKRWKITMVIHF